MNDETGETHPLRADTLYLLDGHEHHRVRANTDVRTVWVFSPPVTAATRYATTTGPTH